MKNKIDIKTLLIVSFQHIFAMFGSTILVPTLVNSAVGTEILSVPVTLISSGVGTLIYIIVTKGKSPGFLGSSFAYITPMIIGFTSYTTGSVFTGIIAIGIVYLLVAVLIKLIGNKWIDKLLPPVVVGPMIIVIGLSLASTVVDQIGLNLIGDVSLKELLVALVTFLTVSIVAISGKGFFKASPFIIGIFVGYIFSVFLGLIDFTHIVNAPNFVIPNFSLAMIDYEFNFDAMVLILPLAIVSVAEHVGTHFALESIINKPVTKDPGLHRTMIGNGLAIIFAGLTGAPANTIYNENLSVVGVTKVTNIKTIILASGIIISLGFLGKISAIFESIPSPVLGAVTLLLYGYIVINGFKLLVENKIDLNNMRNIMVISVMLIIGLGGAAFSLNTNDISITITGMSLSAILGIILNLTLPQEKTSV